MSCIIMVSDVRGITKFSFEISTKYNMLILACERKELDVPFLTMQSQSKGCIEILLLFHSSDTMKCHQNYLSYKATRN